MHQDSGLQPLHQTRAIIYDAQHDLKSWFMFFQTKFTPEFNFYRFLHSLHIWWKYMKNENHTKTIKLNTWFYIWLSVGKEKHQPKNNNMMINEK